MSVGIATRNAGRPQPAQYLGRFAAARRKIEYAAGAVEAGKIFFQQGSNLGKVRVGVAFAKGLVVAFGAVGLGSDTGNSIRGPSSHQALVGIRSTMGLTSRAGVFPLNFLADVAGPMARSVADATAVFQVIVGDDPNDSATAAARGRAIPTYADALKRDALKGMRIGVLRQAYEREGTDPEIVQVFMTALEDLKRAGAMVIDPAPVDGLDAIRRPAGMGPCRAFKYDLNEFLAARKGKVPVNDLTEIVKGGKFHPTVRRQLSAFAGSPVKPAGFQWTALRSKPDSRGYSLSAM